ncbi:hypothetical protein V5799_000308 [Amblyomma americanum]|uniref:Uncharacterized protein n=1 Tax=Amblyomma americanum TaxID=6943 RepID=A0AAQ4D3E8_AMBAM
MMISLNLPLLHLFCPGRHEKPYSLWEQIHCQIFHCLTSFVYDAATIYVKDFENPTVPFLVSLLIPRDFIPIVSCIIPSEHVTVNS